MKKQDAFFKHFGKRVLAAALTLLLVFTLTVPTQAMEIGEYAEIEAADAIAGETQGAEDTEEVSGNTGISEESEPEVLPEEPEEEPGEDPELSTVALGATTIDKDQTLTSNQTITGDVVLKASLDLAGHTLHITGRLLHVSGKIDFNNGLLQVDGNYVARGDETGDDGKLKKSNGTLYFNDANDRMIVGGDFYADSNYYGYFTAGTLQCKGNVTDCTGNTIRGSETQVTIFNGTGTQIVDLQEESACFNYIHTVNTDVRFKQIGIRKLDQDITLTGDVLDVKNAIDLNGHTMTINGSVTKTDGDAIEINGGKLHITGSFRHVNGKVGFDGGTLQVDGSYIAEDTALDDAGKPKKANSTLYMKDTGDHMIVGGNFYANSNYYGYLTGGTLELKGNVTECTGNTIRGSGNHVSIFNGSSAQVVDLQTESACFNIVRTVNTNVRFKQLGINKLDQNTTLTGDVLDVKNEIDLQGNTLTINGNVTKTDGDSIQIDRGKLHITGYFRHAQGALKFDNGTLQVDGNYVAEYAEKGDDGKYKKANSTLYFNNEKDRMIVGGDFYANSNYYGYFTAGTLEVKGNVTDCTGNTIRGSENQLTIFNGSGTQVVDLQTESACFNMIHTVNPKVRFKKIGIRQLDQDITLTGDVEDVKNTIDLKGHTMTIYGNVTKTDGDAIEINGGKLHITGNFRHVAGKVGFDGGTLRIDGSYIAQDATTGDDGLPKHATSTLYMKNDGDYMLVGGDFTARSDYYGYCTNGVLEIKGDVADYTGNTIRASGTEHKTILSGSGSQSVDFSQSSSARFHILEIIKQRSNYTFNPDPCWDEGCLIQGSPTPVSGVALDETTLSVATGESARLIATILPASATEQGLTWSSDSKSIATVDTEGLVTGVSEGTARITVTTVDGGFAATCTVTVTKGDTPGPGPEPGDIPVTGISLDKTTLTLKVGETGKLTSTIAPLNATIKNIQGQLVGTAGVVTGLKVIRSSEDSPYGTLTFTATKTGQETVRVVTMDGGFTADCLVTVTDGGDTPDVPVSNVTLDKSSVQIGVGETIVLTSTVWPSNVSNTNVKWTTSEDSLAWGNRTLGETTVREQSNCRTSTFTTVGKKVGTVTVTATSEDGTHAASCTINVVDTGSDVRVSSVKLDKKKLTLKVGDTGKLKATVGPKNADDLTVYWTHFESATGVFNNIKTSTGTDMVNPTFEFTAEKAGTATIWITTKDGGYTASCEVIVKDPQKGDVAVKGISLSRTSMTLTVGDTGELVSTINPSTATNTAVSWDWTSPQGGVLNHTKATYTTGDPTSTYSFVAEKAGKATVTVKTADGGFTASCVVTVKSEDPTPQDPGEGYTFWGVSENVDGDVLTVSLIHTDETTYDGRKHVVGQVGTKKTVESASVNPDIDVLDFSVTLGDIEVPGISIKSYSYKNNQLASNDGVDDQQMYLYPALSFDSKDQDLKEIMKTHPNFKTKLTQMLKPTINKSTGTWTYEPIAVTINRIELSESTPVYTKDDLKTNPGLATTDGILVWNGKPYNKNLVTKKAKYNNWATKAEFKGLYYQKVYTLPNGKTSVKKINLKAGEWQAFYNHSTGEGYMTMKSKTFDYYLPEEYVATSLPTMLVNGDDTNWMDRGWKIKRSCFTGTLPNMLK